ncbi:MAG: hypothetical protein PUB87_08830 [Eubacteriaceae bacterium]|nr:hypothetical protein [Eubacteriaceae bacterium]
MKIKIYINNRPVEDYSEKELKEIKRKLNEKAMNSAGFERRKPEHVKKG